MVDHLGFGLGQQPDEISADDIGLNKGEAGLTAGTVEIGRPAGTEVVDADDTVPIGKQPVDQVRADETGSPGNQCPHWATIPALLMHPPVQSRRCLFGRPCGCHRSPRRPRR